MTKPNTLTKKNRPTKSDIYFEYNFTNLFDSFNNAKDFLEKCLKGQLINNRTNKFETSLNPTASAVIPFYNRKKTISRAIKSIQNQDITDLEIILVNDFSTNETLSMIEQLQKYDKRIKVINNKKNMGILYSRSIGALAAKGKYIFPLDSDDMVLDKDVYSSMSSIADKGGFDIVGFRIIFSSYGSDILTNRISEYYYSGHPNNKVLFQPELGNYPLRPGNTFGEYKIADVFFL